MTNTVKLPKPTTKLSHNLCLGLMLVALVGLVFSWMVIFGPVAEIAVAENPDLWFLALIGSVILFAISETLRSCYKLRDDSEFKLKTYKAAEHSESLEVKNYLKTAIKLRGGELFCKNDLSLIQNFVLQEDNQKKCAEISNKIFTSGETK